MPYFEKLTVCFEVLAVFVARLGLSDVFVSADKFYHFKNLICKDYQIRWLIQRYTEITPVAITESWLSKNILYNADKTWVNQFIKQISFF